MKRFMYPIIAVGLLCISISVSAQEENILLDRKFWKSNPSLEEVKAKVDEGHSATALTPYNFDATGYAILEKAPMETIKFLLAQGNDVNKLTHDARTYIFWAAYKDNIELMKYLVSKGAKTDILDQHGYSILTFAAVTGQENKALYDYIIELGGNVLEEKDRSGRNSLLAYASSTKTGDMIDYFIDKGLDVNSVDKNGNGIFHYAAMTGNKALLERLINDYNVSTAKNETTNETAILFASRRFSRSGEETEIAFYSYLEGLGLDPAIVSNEGNTVLQNLAYRSNNPVTFNYFLDKGVDINQVNDEGNNALINASSRKGLEIMTLLADKTENINHTNKEGYSAFTRALKYNKMEVAKFLESKGADTKVIDANGHNLVYHIVDAYRGDLDNFKEKLGYLKNLGHDPMTKQEDGSTLLHAAINKDDHDLLKFLVDMGIDVNAKDADGHTILHYAAMQSGDENTLKYLIAAGADKSITTEFDESVYDLAQANELLIENQTDIDFLRTDGE
ncbi:MAG: ankyrin repeat domain-containing protein [Bacteroidota bacterium]